MARALLPLGVEYDIGPNESVSAAVVRAVSAHEGRHPESLPALYTVVDPDALDDLFAPRAVGTARSGGRISFIYSTLLVTIDNGEYLTLQSLDLRPLRVDGEHRPPCPAHRD